MKLEIRRLGHLGDGVADGPVFVAGALPGEIVEGEPVQGRLESPRILTPSPDRVSAPCRHYKSCGGCGLQHASDEFVARWKLEVVVSALAAQELRAPMRPIATSPPRSRRRATLAGRRTKKGALVGFHARAADALVELPGCILLRPELVAMLPVLQLLVSLAASRKAEVRLSLALSDTGPDLAVSSAKPLDGPLFAELGSISQKHRLARLTWNDDVVAELHPPVQRFGRAAVVPPPGAFLQATAEGQQVLTDAVKECLGQARSVADLFSGCGTFALPLAECAEVHAVEGEAEMLRALDAGWRKTAGLKRVTTETRDLFRQPLLADELNRFDAVVIDPPRAGAEAQARQLAASQVARIAYVSCNPVAFARDAAILAQAGFSIDWVQVVDQFRWSPHVELAACLSRR